MARDVAVDRWKKRYPTGSYFFDMDGDEDLDLLVTALAGSTTLFQNEGNGHFKDVTKAAGMEYVGASTTAAIGDYDRDGDVDVYMATYRPYGFSKYNPVEAAPGPEPEMNYEIDRGGGHTVLHPERDVLFQNQGNGTFKDVTEASGIGLTKDWGLAASFGDLTGDGWPDLYVANDFDTPDRLWANQRDGSFKPLPVPAFRHTPWFSMGMDIGDINNDGNMDIFASDMLSADRMTRQTQSMGSMAGMTELPAKGTAGEQVMRNTLHVNNGDGTWSDIAFFAGVAATDWTWSVKFADLDLDGWQDLLVTNGFVNDAMNGDVSTHQTTDYNDFKEQPLLPYKLTQLGPGVAWRDANGDGWDDLYVAGGSNAAGGLFMNGAGKAFTAQPNLPVPPGVLEEQSVLFWPGGAGAAGGSGAGAAGGTTSPFGILASLGSVATADPSEHRVARLLGSGSFAEADWAPKSPSSGGALAAADYNGDGFLDLFVGGRVRPTQYPLATGSLLFKGGADGLAAADADAPELANLGMATGATWADVDNDKDPDLLVATEFGPVRLFVNSGGKLADGTRAAGLAELTGWWNGLAVGDVDHDGDLDVAATNLGLNTRYTATKETPLVVFGGDMDGDGTSEIVETEWDAGQLYPSRQGYEITMDFPDPMKVVPSYQAFAQMTLDGLMGDALKTAKRFEANTFAHTLFTNDGKGHFAAQPLPLAAQLMTGFGVVMQDLDDDGHTDIYLVGNLYSTEMMHTGPLDAGVSVWLKGDGKGGFAAAPVAESGLSVPYDAKGLAAADFNQDGWVDLAVGLHNGPGMLFQNGGVAGRKGLVVKLVGDPKNPAAAGARITVTRGDGLVMTREVTAGGSYWSADGGTHVFGLGDADGPSKVVVRWPDGTEKTVDGAKSGAPVVVTYP